MILNTEKERIDSGFFLHQAEVKKKKEKVDKRRKEEDKSKSASIELGAMFEMDSFESSDDDFIYPQKRIEVKQKYFIHLLKTPHMSVLLKLDRRERSYKHVANYSRR